MALTSIVTAKIGANLTNPNDLGAPVYNLTPKFFPDISLSSGVGPQQADRLFSDTRTLAISATENIDVAGALTDPLGTALSMATVKVLYIKAWSANTNDVLVGGGGATALAGIFGDAASDIVRVKPGGIFMWVAPKIGAGVTATTADILKVANGGAGTPVTYDIVIIGTSS